MRILFLSRWLPYPADNGSKIRIFNVLKQLAQRHEIALVSFREGADRVDDAVRRAMADLCVSTHAVPFRPFQPSSARAVVGLFSPRPRSLVDTDSRAMHAAVATAYWQHRPDAIIASELGMVPYSLALPRRPTLLEDLELSIFWDAANGHGTGRGRARALLTWLKLRMYLRRALPRFAACTVPSVGELAKVRQAVPAYSNVEVLPNAVDLSSYGASHGSPVPGSIVFAGALSYQANHDAASYFLSDVYPTIARSVPELTMRVSGAIDGVDLSALPRYPGLEYTGRVVDIRPIIAQSWVSVVPLRRGGGTRLKILESMALGTPVVATSKGAEGLEVTNGQDILIADEPGELARRIVELLRSPELRQRLAAAGRRLVASKYDWAAVGVPLRALVERIAA